MGRKGGLKNERKANPKRVAGAKALEAAERERVIELKKLPIGQRPANYSEVLSKAEGILNRTRAKGKKSETHSRRGKGA